MSHLKSGLSVYVLTVEAIRKREVKFFILRHLYIHFITHSFMMRKAMDYKQRISEYSAADAEIQGGIYLYLAYGLYDAAVATVYVIIG